MTDAEILVAIKRAEDWPTYTDHPADLGGPTKGGITLATLRAWRNDPTLGPEDLAALDESEANAIFKFLFFKPFARIPDDALRHYLIDLGVLRGPRRAARMLQDVVGVPADGWVGPVTLQALAPYARHALVMLIGVRFAHIAERVRDDPTQQVFARGWRNRNDRFLP